MKEKLEAVYSCILRKPCRRYICCFRKWAWKLFVHTCWLSNV